MNINHMPPALDTLAKVVGLLEPLDLDQRGWVIDFLVKHRPEPGPSPSTPAELDEWVIIDTRDVVGNSASFWRPEGRGYTCDLQQAGRYTREQAEAQHRSRATDLPARLADLLPLVQQHVDLQNYRNRLPPRTTGAGPKHGRCRCADAVVIPHGADSVWVGNQRHSRQEGCYLMPFAPPPMDQPSEKGPES